MGLVQVEVGGDKVALARCVVAGEPRLRCVVATVVAEVPEGEVSRQIFQPIVSTPVERRALFRERV